MNKQYKLFFLMIISGLLSACSGFFDKDNTPTPSALVNFTPEVTVKKQWSTRTTNGVGQDYLKLMPASNSLYIFTADKNGKVTATHKHTGKNQWQIDLRVAISAGPASNENRVVVATRNGEIITLDAMNGKSLWRKTLSSEILAPPTIDRDIVLIKSIDGQLAAYALTDGRLLWKYQQTEPSLILRGSSQPKVTQNTVVAGFANGHLNKLTLEGGNLLWQTMVAQPQGSFAIERMVDIDADPVIHHQTVYAATYQGRIAALTLLTGKEKWVHDLSSYTGMTVDDQKIYISDAKSYLWAFEQENGTVNWRQVQLAARNITAPILMGRYLVVGDAEGYLHWLSRADGHTVARIRVNSAPIIATPLVQDNILYVYTTDGYLAAYAFA